MRGSLAAVAGAIAWLASASGAAAAKGCKLNTLAELPVTIIDMQPTVMVQVNGQPVRMIADSGAFFSLLTTRAADRVKLRRGALPPGYSVGGAMGPASVGLGIADEFQVQNGTWRKVDFLVGSDFGDKVDGLLGQNMLGRLDVEYDLANGVIRLFKPEGCGEAALSYWAAGPGVSIVPIRSVTPLEPHIIGDAKVDGHPIRVVFDTGAGLSALKLGVAQRVGLHIDADGARAGGYTRGIGLSAVDESSVPVDSFSVGEETIQHTRLRVAKVDVSIGDMLLGADFFLSHRVLVAYSQQRLYFTYNGGPVFRIEDFKPVADGPESSPAATAGPQLDAGALSRRGSAYLARRDFAHAVDDFGRAAELEPNVAHHYYDRARARWGLGQANAALLDLDHALRLDPKDVDALLARGEIHLKANQDADADFAAALEAAPKDGHVSVEVAERYAQAGRFDRAITLLDDWLAAHPKDRDTSFVLNGRCRSRALWGRELDKALADCDLALRRGSRLASVFDSRGLAHLRRGEFDLAIADYNQAIKLQPRHAWAFYGRGLAELKKGDGATAQADMAAAAAMDPEVVEDARRFGLTEQAAVVAGR